MVYRESGGRPVLNWQYVDMVYDHWLSVGIRPFRRDRLHALRAGQRGRDRLLVAGQHHPAPRLGPVGVAGAELRPST